MNPLLSLLLEIPLSYVLLARMLVTDKTIGFANVTVVRIPPACFPRAQQGDSEIALTRLVDTVGTSFGIGRLPVEPHPPSEGLACPEPFEIGSPNSMRTRYRTAAHNKPTSIINHLCYTRAVEIES